MCNTTNHARLPQTSRFQVSKESTFLAFGMFSVGPTVGGTLARFAAVVILGVLRLVVSSREFQMPVFLWMI